MTMKQVSGEMGVNDSHPGETQVLKQQHPGFTIICDVCGGSQIRISKWSWGSVDLECLDCEQIAVILWDY
jgi:hypothetical protein